MILQVADGNGILQQICVQSVGTPTDRSGTIVTSGASQVLMDAVPDGAELPRSGWLVQNNSQTGFSMQINEIGSDADTSPTSIYLAPGAFFPPPGYPVTQGEITIAGQSGDNYAAREW